MRFQSIHSKFQSKFFSPLLISSILASLLVPGCASRSSMGPREATFAFCNSITNGKIEEAYDMFSAEVKAETSLEEFRKKIQVSMSQANNKPNASCEDILLAEKTPLVIEIQKTRIGDSIALIFENGQWRIHKDASQKNLPIAASSTELPSTNVTMGWRQEAKIPVSSDDPQLGPKNAPVTVVVYSDYQCPYCSKVEPTLKKLREEYGDKIRIVWKDLPLPFHSQAEPTAITAQALFLARGNDAFWKFHDTIFENQQRLNEDTFIKQKIEELGVSFADLQLHITRAAQKVRTNSTEASQHGLSGTPSFKIDGETLVGARSIDQFRTVIDAHLKQAEELRSKGVADNDLYIRMVDTFYTKPEDKVRDEAPEDPSIWNVAIGKSPVLGKKDALVTIVTFSDFECPYCKTLEPTLQKVKQEYGDQVRFVFKHNPLPFHSRAVPAAMFAIEAMKQKGTAGFWAAHNKLFQEEQKLEDNDLELLAKNLGLNATKVMDAIRTTRHKSLLEMDLDQADDLNVQGTPNSYVNGRSVQGNQPYEKFKKVIDEELAKAKKLVDSGVKPERVYDEIIKNGKGSLLPTIKIPAHAPTKGAKNAKVTIHIFSDFQCPFCQRVAVPYGESDENGDGASKKTQPGFIRALEKFPGKVKVVWRNFPLPFHSRAEPAAHFALEAFTQKGNDTFWKIHDELFSSKQTFEEGELKTIADKYTLDWTKLKEAMDNKKYSKEIEQDRKQAQELNIHGTPAFFINGRIVSGARDAASFEKAIERALKSAK